MHPQWTRLNSQRPRWQIYKTKLPAKVKGTMFQAVQIAYNREIKAHMFQARNQGDKDLKTGWVTKKSMVLIVF